MKVIIFDASTIINFIMNGLTDMLIELKSIFQGKFIITHQVKYEVIDKPLTIKRFKLGALKAKMLLESGILELPDSIGIKNFDINNKTREILKQVNKVFAANNESIKLIHDGEASCLALSFLASKKDIDNLLAVDERTTRMLIEKPGNLRKLMKRKLHKSVQIRGKFPNLGKIKIIRSTELVYLAYKKNLTKFKNGVLDALLYATKFKGSAISDQEIEQIKKIQ